jgi:RHS repeat-associated protein
MDGTAKTYTTDRLAPVPSVIDDGSAAYLTADDGLVAAIKPSGSASYALNDRLGSVRGLTDSAGAVTATASYSAFGSLRASTGTQTGLGFAGEPNDPTGLVYLRARSLDPTTGRMLQADTVRPSASGTQGYNLYAYATNNPTEWTDPTGHFSGSPDLKDLPTLWEVFKQNEPVILGAVSAEAAACLGLPMACGTLLVLGITLAVVFLFVGCILADWCRELLGGLYNDVIENGSSTPGTQTLPTNVADAADTYPNAPTQTEPSPSPSPIILPPGVRVDEEDGERRAVIGENGPAGSGFEKRVERAAGRLGAAWFKPIVLENFVKGYQSLRMEHNRHWIVAMMADHRLIIDIGPAKGRPEYPEVSSPYYAMELEMTAAYPLKTRMFWDGG